MKFDWDEKKAAANLAKHGVSFDQAKTAFDDPFFVEFFDPEHSDEEERYILIGESSEGRLLMVSYTERDDTIRIVSSRELTAAERNAYEEG